MAWGIAVILYTMGAVMMASLTCEDEGIHKHLFSVRWFMWVLCWPFVWWTVIVGTVWHRVWNR